MKVREHPIFLKGHRRTISMNSPAPQNAFDEVLVFLPRPQNLWVNK